MTYKYEGLLSTNDHTFDEAEYYTEVEALYKEYGQTFVKPEVKPDNGYPLIFALRFYLDKAKNA